MLDNAWEGFNCSLFAYGQTGSGKSYSMVGYGANKGILHMMSELLAVTCKCQRIIANYIRQYTKNYDNHIMVATYSSDFQSNNYFKEM